MKNLAGTSVFLLGVLIFILLALAIYVFRTFPYLLGLVLLAEVLVLTAAILAPLLSGGARSGWFGRAVFALIAAALANSYMLFLADRWGVNPEGLYRVILHWQEGVLALAGFVIAFLDAVLKAVFGLSQGPIAGFLSGLHPPQRLDLDAIPGAGRMGPLSIGMILNVLLGVVASLWAATVVKRVLPRAHAKSAGHH